MIVLCSQWKTHSTTHSTCSSILRCHGNPYQILSESFSCSLSQPLPPHRHSMDRYERVVTCKVMRLRSQETLSGRKEYIVVGTREEFQCKGKVGE